MGGNASSQCFVDDKTDDKKAQQVIDSMGMDRRAHESRRPTSQSSRWLKYAGL